MVSVLWIEGLCEDVLRVWGFNVIRVLIISLFSSNIRDGTFKALRLCAEEADVVYV